MALVNLFTAPWCSLMAKSSPSTALWCPLMADTAKNKRIAMMARAREKKREEMPTYN